MFASIRSRVGVLPGVLADLTGPLGDRVRRGLPESSIIAQLGGGLWEIQDIRGVAKEAMALGWMGDALRWIRSQGPQRPTC